MFRGIESYTKKTLKQLFLTNFGVRDSLKNRKPWQCHDDTLSSLERREEIRLVE